MNETTSGRDLLWGVLLPYIAAHPFVDLGVEADFTPARKAHPAFLVDDLAGLAARLAAAGHAAAADQPLDGYDRLHVHDPFGNRVELMQRRT